MRSIANAVLLGILALLLSATLTTQDAQAATLEEFNDTCFTENGFEGTDGCFEAAESLGVEMDNLLESIEQGCTRYFEDYSCKEGSSDPPSSSSVSEQAEVSEQGTVSEQEPLELVTEGSLITDYNARTQEAILYDPTMDVVGASYETAVVEWIEPVSEQDSVTEQEWPTPTSADHAENLEESKAKGCTPENLFEDLSCKGPQYRGYEYVGERPVTQQGTLAPLNWKSHVTKVKPAPKTGALSTANPMIKGDTGVDVEAKNKRTLDSPAKTAAHELEVKAQVAKIMSEQAQAKKAKSKKK